MKLRQEQVDKLREGKATLVADHSKPEMMDKVLKEAFPKDNALYCKYVENYYTRSGIYNDEWSTIHLSEVTIGKLIPLDDFFEKEEKEMTTHRVKINMPATAEERDQIVKELQAMEFKKELPSELEEMFAGDLTDLDFTLIKLLRRRDVYRDGWTLESAKFDEKKWIIDYNVYEENSEHHVKRVIDWSWYGSRAFSFQDEETAELFLSNFKEELEQVKHLIS